MREEFQKDAYGPIGTWDEQMLTLWVEEFDEEKLPAKYSIGKQFPCQNIDVYCKKMKMRSWSTCSLGVNSHNLCGKECVTEMGSRILGSRDC